MWRGNTLLYDTRRSIKTYVLVLESEDYIMTRKEEVENNMKDLLERIRDLTGSGLTQEQVMNINLSSIAQQLGDISVTLAIIADKLDKEDKQ